MTMNCEDYRKALGADPEFDGGEEHVGDCGACRSYRNDLMKMEVRIGAALALAVPPLSMPELPAIDSSNITSLQARRRLTAPAWLAVAATVVLATFVGVRMLSNEIQFNSLADEVLAHLDHEPYALRVSDKPVSAARLARVVPADVAQMDHSAGLITYAQTCVINGHEVPHLVIQGEKGPVTILLMPEEMLDEAVSLGDETVQGVILPVGNGSIAIIGGRDEALAPIQQQVLNSAMWST